MRRPRFNFIEMGIKIGSELVSIKSGEIAKVHNQFKVEFRGEIMSLTQATKRAANNLNTTALGLNWTFKNVKLFDIYNKTYK